MQKAAAENKTDDQTPIERAVRVFISSTFRDMRKEREELVKQVFPELRRLCDSRAVVWSEVDPDRPLARRARAAGLADHERGRIVDS